MTTARVAPLELPARLTAPPRLTQRHPVLLPAAVLVHRTRRRVRWTRDALAGRVGDELVRSNCALVVYEPGPDVEVIDVG